ncbi:indole-3-glycerol phosphate synthase TrpC [Nannocystis sp.]|uniref:indole-3-glycerol phosphate synthase TrpC n=1 Tax=Nannocystis sp. TaxID=1962667 RepID=UPI00242487CE|nr:indole-3-glycerol phosphate synthase TrpC [Nannocystis sp.]MBK7826718.1 indole-3-glycerol-phosphate synthase [Nannocystis sp.]MBK9754338.1 indole-3-glycerol-phosphate synthase [Nannocystis sp.]
MTGTGGSFLDKILAAKRAELAGARATRSAALSDRDLLELGARLPRPRDFTAALREGPRPAIIAEFKRASPSAGWLREDADPRHIGTLYAAGGATCMSIVTDRHYGGSFDDLRAVRQTVTLPLLCKDFILEKTQIVEAKRVGADCVLLIVAALPPPQLRALLEFTRQLDMQALVETRDEHELDRAMAAGARLIAVNARDLDGVEIDVGRAARLRKLVPDSFTYVAESGVHSVDDAIRLRDAGVDAILIGSYLMEAANPGEALRQLILQL